MKQIILDQLENLGAEIHKPKQCEHREYCLSPKQSLSKCVYGTKCPDRLFYDRYGKNGDELGI